MHAATGKSVRDLGLQDCYTYKSGAGLFDPMNPELPYLYDNFDWEYCSEEGYHFPPV